MDTTAPEKRRMCQHCSQTSEMIEPLKEFHVVLVISDANRSMSGDDGVRKNIRLGSHCGCHDLFMHGTRQGEYLRHDHESTQVRYLALWMGSQNRFAGAGYRNYQAKEIPPKVIPVTLAVLLGLEMDNVVEQSFQHKVGLDLLIGLGLTPEDVATIKDYRERILTGRMVEANRRLAVNYLLRPANADLLDKIKANPELVEVLRKHQMIELGLPTDPKSSVDAFLERNKPPGSQ